MNSIRRAGELCYLAGVLLLPFTWDLVLDVGVPLKSYEVLFAVSLLCFALTYEGWRVLFARRPVLLLTAFLAAVLISAVAGIRIIKDIPVPLWATGRDHPYGSIALEYLYLLFDAGVLLMTVAYLRNRERLTKVMNLLAAGSVVVCLYGIVQLIFYKVSGHTPLLPTMSGRRALVEFIIPRITGSFKEPNYLAGFLVCVIPYSLVKLYGSRREVQLFAGVLAVQLAGLYFTFSTAGWLVFALMTTVFLVRGYRYDRRRTVAIAAALAGTLVIVVLANPRIFYEVIYDKLFGRFINPNTISRIERQQQVMNGLRLFVRHPFTGIGLSNYGLVADHAFGLGATFNLTVNSVFVEILCETGITGFALFTAFTGSVIITVERAVRCESSGGTAVLQLGMLCSLLSLVMMLNVYPSHSLTFIWVIFGAAAAAGRGMQVNQSR